MRMCVHVCVRVCTYVYVWGGEGGSRRAGDTGRSAGRAGGDPELRSLLRTENLLLFPHTSQPATSAEAEGCSRSLRETDGKGVFPGSPVSLSVLAGGGRAQSPALQIKVCLPSTGGSTLRGTLGGPQAALTYFPLRNQPVRGSVITLLGSLTLEFPNPEGPYAEPSTSVFSGEARSRSPERGHPLESLGKLGVPWSLPMWPWL